MHKEDNYVGEALRELRIKANLSQRELGDAAGLSGDAICRYEGGSREPSTAIMKRLASGLGVSLQTVYLTMAKLA